MEKKQFLVSREGHPLQFLLYGFLSFLYSFIYAHTVASFSSDPWEGMDNGVHRCSSSFDRVGQKCPDFSLRRGTKSKCPVPAWHLSTAPRETMLTWDRLRVVLKAFILRCFITPQTSVPAGLTVVHWGRESWTNPRGWPIAGIYCRVRSSCVCRFSSAHNSFFLFSSSWTYKLSLCIALSLSAAWCARCVCCQRSLSSYIQAFSLIAGC